MDIIHFGFQISEYLKERSQKFVAGNFVILANDVILLTDKGKLIADKIVLDLMLDED